VGPRQRGDAPYAALLNELAMFIRNALRDGSRAIAIGEDRAQAPRGGCPRDAWRPTTQLEPNTPINVPLGVLIRQLTDLAARTGWDAASERRGSAACPRV
jgi:hypothetical protein